MQTGQAIKKYIFIILGCLSIVLGIFGIFLPLLPTTPFLLLAAYFFTRSSKRLHNWLIHHKTFGKYIYDYQTYRAMDRKTKRVAIVSMWCSLLFSMILVSELYLRLLLTVIGIGVSWYILSLRTLKNQDTYFKVKEKEWKFSAMPLWVENYGTLAKICAILIEKLS